jgi:eukaryotic-like serine/threonine-protein kinase
MLQRWSQIILPLSCLVLFFSSCSKKTGTSTDTPLPTPVSPSIIITSDNQVVYALDPTTGAKHWELPLPVIAGNPNVEFAPSPLLYKGRLYITTINSDTVYKINPQTGTIVRKLTPVAANSFTVKATPIADGGMIYIAATDNNLYAIDTADGHIIWQFSADGPLVSSPTIYNNDLYIASTAGTLYDLDKSSGNQNWTYQPLTAYGSTIVNAKFISSPAVSYPYVYIGSVSDSNMYCIYASGVIDASGSLVGAERWRFKTKGAIYSSPSVLSGHVIFGSNDNHVYCVDSTINPPMGVNTPRVIWNDSANNQVWSSPYAYNQVIFVGSYDYNLYALNIRDGGIKWKFATTGLIKSSPLAYKGMVYVGSYDKRLYAVDSATGTVKWSQNINGAIQCSPIIDDISNKNQNNSGISGYVQ